VIATGIASLVPADKKLVWISVRDSVTGGEDEADDEGHEEEAAGDVGAATVRNWPILKILHLALQLVLILGSISVVLL